MCQPGKPCDAILAVLRGPMEQCIVNAIANVVVESVLVGVHTLDGAQLHHLHHGLGTTDVGRVGRSIGYALIAERLPEVASTRDAINEVRGALMRRVLTPTYAPAAPLRDPT